MAAASLAITIAVQAEVALLFLGAGILGVFYYGSMFRGRGIGLPVFAALPLAAGKVTGAAVSASGSILWKLLTFFLTAGSFTFGSGLVIAPFLEKGLVQQTG